MDGGHTSAADQQLSPADTQLTFCVACRRDVSALHLGMEKSMQFVYCLLLRMITVRSLTLRQQSSKRVGHTRASSCCYEPARSDVGVTTEPISPLLLRVPSHRTSFFCEDFRPAITLAAAGLCIQTIYTSMMVDPWFHGLQCIRPPFPAGVDPPSSSHRP